MTSTERDEAIADPDTHRCVPPAPISVTARLRASTHRGHAVAPRVAESHTLSDNHDRFAPASNFSSSQVRDGTQKANAAEPTPAGQQGQTVAHSSGLPGGFLRDPVLGVLADVVDDLESVRIANANRVRQLTRTATDKDGQDRGFGLTLDHPEVAKLALTVEVLKAAEKDAVKNLQLAMRKHPLAGYEKRNKGIGEKQLARLLAVIGDPYWNDLHDRPRTVSELWAFCGLHVIRTSSSSQRMDDAQSRLAAAGDQPHTESQTMYDTHRFCAPGVAPKRQRGKKSNWNGTARNRIWVIASAMPKFPGGHYEQFYRDARMKYADAVHDTECPRCGPAGAPAKVGSPLSAGHRNARAVRLVMKEILKDLWSEARDLHVQRQHAAGSQDEEAPST